MKDETLYRRKYFFALYENDDETLYDIYNNTRMLVKACGLEVTRNNVAMMSLKITRAIRKDDHNIRLFGRNMKLYLVDVDDNDDNDYKVDIHTEHKAKEEQSHV